MEIRYERGILISHQGNKLLLDPEYSSVPFGIPSIVSHAHSDHTAAMSGTGKTFVNNDTLQLFKVAQHQKRARNIHVQTLYEPFEIGPFEIEFIRAGHLLGAPLAHLSLARIAWMANDSRFLPLKMTK